MAKQVLNLISRIRQLAVIAMVSDDELMEKLVIKGGNLLDMFYGISTRSSVDIDFSVDGDLGSTEALQEQVTKALTRTFSEHGYVAFDINVLAVPPNLTEDRKDFWGGYKIDFKIIEQKRYQKLKGDLSLLRKSSLAVGRRGSTKFQIDISNYEYCDGKEARELDGFRVYAYSPTMFVCEKLRAICQQMPKYAKTVQSKPSPRARDFVDICSVMEGMDIDIRSTEFQETLKLVFGAKRVPLELIQDISEFREFHRVGFQSVKDTVDPEFKLIDYDFYFDHVLELSATLKSL